MPGTSMDIMPTDLGYIFAGVYPGAVSLERPGVKFVSEERKKKPGGLVAEPCQV